MCRLFSRAWVVQEVVNSREIAVHCAGESIRG